jgi:hypothetical protein
LKEANKVDYCAAEHKNTNVGCYGRTGHKGPHWSYSSQTVDQTGEKQNDKGNWIWEWDNEAPAVPAGSAAVVLTREELGILHTLLLPVQHFFPDLTEKLTDARVSL